MQCRGKRKVSICLAVCTVIAAAAAVWQFVQHKPTQEQSTQGVKANVVSQSNAFAEPSSVSLPESTSSLESAVLISPSSGAQPLLEDGKNYAMYMQVEYLFTSMTDLYRESDLVIYAEYLHDNECVVDNVVQIISTVGEARVLQVLKGNCEEEIVPVLFTGGTVSSAQYLSAMDEDAKQYNGIKETEFLETYQTVTLKTDEMAKLESGKSYLLFLTYAEEYELYSVAGDCYAAREVSEDGKIYSPEQGAFITDDTGLFAVQKKGGKLQFLPPTE